MPQLIAASDIVIAPYINTQGPSDYPDFAHILVNEVKSSPNNVGILICGSGVGMSITANRDPKIRAGLVHNSEIAKLISIKDDYDLIINYGTAASKVYDGLVDCTMFIQRDMDATPLGFKKGDTPYDTDVPNMISFATLSNTKVKNLTC